MCTYNWFTLLYSRTYHNIVKQLYSIFKFEIFLKKLKGTEKKDKEAEAKP